MAKALWRTAASPLQRPPVRVCVKRGSRTFGGTAQSPPPRTGGGVCFTGMAERVVSVGKQARACSSNWIRSRRTAAGRQRCVCSALASKEGFAVATSPIRYKETGSSNQEMKTFMKKLKLLYYLVILTAPDLYDNKKLSLECHFSVAAARCSRAVVTGKPVDSHWYTSLSNMTPV